MREAAATLVGTHDFAAFQSAGTETSTTARTVTRSEIVAGGADPSGLRTMGPQHVIAYEITGNGFLRHMVRAIVGTLVEIGRGWRTAASIPPHGSASRC